jgi:hypothetical protein
MDMYNTKEDTVALISYLRDWLNNAKRGNNKICSHHLSSKHSRMPHVPKPNYLLNPEEIWIAHLNKIAHVKDYLNFKTKNNIII